MRSIRLFVIQVWLMVFVLAMPRCMYAIDPVDPNLIQAGRNILDYFESVYGQNTVTGVWNNQSRLVETVFDCTGKYPAIIGEDLCGWNATKFSSLYVLNVQRAMDRLKDYWNEQGGIAHVTFHWPNPLTAGGQFADSQEDLTTAQWNNIVTPGTSEYNTMISELNWHLDYLEQLTDLDIPVLWRPLHEIDGGWFWWTNKDDPSGYFDMGGNNSWVQYTFNVSGGGSYTLGIRYANGSGANRACHVITNGASVANGFSATGSWTSWQESPSSISLNTGSNTIRIQATTGSGGPNIDRLVLTPAGSAGARMATPTAWGDEQKNSMLTYPNPAGSQVTVRGVSLPADVTILNAVGQRIKFMTTTDGVIDIKDLGRGVYFIRGGQHTVKMMKE